MTYAVLSHHTCHLLEVRDDALMAMACIHKPLCLRGHNQDHWPGNGYTNGCTSIYWCKKVTGQFLSFLYAHSRKEKKVVTFIDFS